MIWPTFQKSFLPPSSGSLTLVTVSSSETTVSVYQTTGCNIPEDSHLHTSRRENLKSVMKTIIYLADYNEVSVRWIVIIETQSSFFILAFNLQLHTEANTSIVRPGRCSYLSEDAVFTLCEKFTVAIFLISDIITRRYLVSNSSSHFKALAPICISYRSQLRDKKAFQTSTNLMFHIPKNILLQ
jgi:hypothetical protein